MRETSRGWDKKPIVNNNLKTRAACNLNSKETFLISPDGKGLPVKGWKSNYKTSYLENGKLDLANTNYYESEDLVVIKKLIVAISANKPEIKNIFLDTITMAMFSEYMRTIKDKGYEKYEDIADKVWKLMIVLKPLREDLTIIITGHLETDYDENGVRRTSSKIPAGKILKNKVTLEELFNEVLYTEVIHTNDKSEYYFITQNNGKNTCKSSEGMFDDIRIPNDYDYVIKKMISYEN